MRELVRGAIAGAAGVAGMAGVITSLRRAILTREQLAGAKWHPEKVVESLAAKAGYGELDDQGPEQLISGFLAATIEEHHGTERPDTFEVTGLRERCLDQR